MRRSCVPFLLLMTLQKTLLAGTCALCRQALASGGSEGTIQGFYYSILLIAGVPLIIFAVGFWLIFHAWKKPGTR